MLLRLLRLWTLWATRSVVPKSTGAVLGFAQAVAAMRDDAEDDRAVTDGPTAIIIGNRCQ